MNSAFVRKRQKMSALELMSSRLNEFLESIDKGPAHIPGGSNYFAAKPSHGPSCGTAAGWGGSGKYQ